MRPLPALGAMAVAGVAVVLLLRPTGEAPTPATSTAPAAPTTVAPTAVPEPTTTDPPQPTTTMPAEPAFEGSVSPIDDAVRARMSHSWRPGCPVPLEDLRLLTVSHIGMDGEVHTGELVVHADHARPLLDVFRALFDQRFPIERMELVDVYQGDDDRSMAANNTSAFNCRAVTGGSRWSEHSYGLAVDVNPLLNPFVLASGRVLPSEGARYADRSLREPGMIHPGDEVVAAFEAIGWHWGGYWTSSKDYQHFSATGR